MQYYDFQPDLKASYPILSDTHVIISDNADPNMVQDIILKGLLPGAFSMLGTKVRLILVTVILAHYGIAYWDLIFEYPEYDKALPILEAIYNKSIELEDSFDHFTLTDNKSIYKLSFKVS